MNKLTTDKDLMTCGYCKASFTKGETVYIGQGFGWKDVVIFCDKCRVSHHSNKTIKSGGV